MDKEEEYKLKRVVSRVSPIIYKEMKQGMNWLGLSTESSYIAMAIKALNDRMNKTEKGQ